MSNLLRRQLTQAWEKTIREAYSKMLINSERGLQVHFCLALRETFDCKNTPRSFFVEPTLLLGDKKRIPDLVIYEANQIVAVIELKYAPRSLPDFKKDFETLALIRANAQNLTISNDRYRGPGQPRPTSVAKDIILCWASVQEEREPPSELKNSSQKLGTHYLGLIALTSDTNVRLFTENSP
jgi:hypothetical protein